MSRTVKIVFQKRMPDGALRRSTPLYDSSSGCARIEHAIEYARMLRAGCESGALSSSVLCDMEPNHVLTAYIATAHLERTHIEGSEEGGERGPGLRLDTMAVGYGEWLGDIRQVLFCCIDLDGDLSPDAPVVEDEQW